MKQDTHGCTHASSSLNLLQGGELRGANYFHHLDKLSPSLSIFSYSLLFTPTFSRSLFMLSIHLDVSLLLLPPSSVFMLSSSIYLCSFSVYVLPIVFCSQLSSLGVSSTQPLLVIPLSSLSHFTLSHISLI